MICLIQVSFPNESAALETTRTLLDDRLVACGSILPKVRSLYHWKDAIEDAEEILVLYKSLERLYPAVEERIKELHPYETPEILSFPPLNVLPAYAQWIQEVLG